MGDLRILVQVLNSKVNEPSQGSAPQPTITSCPAKPTAPKATANDDDDDVDLFGSDSEVSFFKFIIFILFFLFLQSFIGNIAGILKYEIFQFSYKNIN